MLFFLFGIYREIIIGTTVFLDLGGGASHTHNARRLPSEQPVACSPLSVAEARLSCEEGYKYQVTGGAEIVKHLAGKGRRIRRGLVNVWNGVTRVLRSCRVAIQGIH
ncbi:hypothetical protein SERLADRAFT_458998 [Serpula lacrymans var. lacrymans S7.9]|uniref:Uncharacterized protein n=1 Tax=Serpula lacrymans var. lacrymans (strain S7.9) TaxID=578457 RepID=F8NL10_SERL9|nr:uncharacterized protein SERLADRAFT_458998 [Serpula lacrymans var. lacrymans S7.9]EGO28518.1 hypothetical protein SERLADRAFT_458998 [Serpula lacrymans var. lacrymans S7.9]